MEADPSLICYITPEMTYPDTEPAPSPHSLPSDFWTALMEKFAGLFFLRECFGEDPPASPALEATECTPLISGPPHTPTRLHIPVRPHILARPHTQTRVKSCPLQAESSQRVEEAQPEPPIPSQKVAATHPRPAEDAIHPLLCPSSATMEPPIIDLDDPRLQRNGREMETGAVLPTQPVRIPYPQPWRPKQSREEALREWVQAKRYRIERGNEGRGRGC
jgi:hypothetical protein